MHSIVPGWGLSCVWVKEVKVWAVLVVISRTETERNMGQQYVKGIAASQAGSACDSCSCIDLVSPAESLSTRHCTIRMCWLWPQNLALDFLKYILFFSVGVP